MSKQQLNNTGNFRTPTNPRDNFTMIPNSVLHNKDLSMKARFLLSFMLSLPPGWNFNERGLATAVGEGRSAVRSALKELMDAKYLYRLQTRGDGGSFGNMIYYLFTEPTIMQVDGECIDNDTAVDTDNVTHESVEEKPLPGIYNIDKDHPDYDYLNGGWMLED